MIKLVCGLLVLASLSSAQRGPGQQGGGRRGPIDRLVNCEDNPCGAGNRPTCSCPDGVTTFSPGEEKQNKINELLASDSNPCGANNIPTCTCSDGSTNTPGSTGPLCPGTGRDRHPDTCTCPGPNGTQMTGKQFAKSLGIKRSGCQ